MTPLDTKLSVRQNVRVVGPVKYQLAIFKGAAKYLSIEYP